MAQRKTNLKKPTQKADLLETDAAQEFVRSAISVDQPRSKGGRPKKLDDDNVRLTLLVPKPLLEEIDHYLEQTATPRMVWIRQAILAALRAEKAEKLSVPEGVMWKKRE